MAFNQGTGASGSSPGLAFSSSGPFQFAAPPSFDGKNYEEFNFKIKAYLSLMNPRYGVVLKDVESKVDTPVEDTYFLKSDGQSYDDELVKMATNLQYVLVTLCHG